MSDENSSALSSRLGKMQGTFKYLPLNQLPSYYVRPMLALILGFNFSWPGTKEKHNSYHFDNRLFPVLKGL